MIALTLILATAMTSSVLALGAASVITPFLTDWVKNKLGVDSHKAYALHLAISAALAAGALFVTGEITPSSFAVSWPAIATGAATIFRFLKKETGLTVEPPSTDEPTE